MPTMASRIREHLRTRYCTPQQHGAQIPPERELMKRFAVSRPTVRNAVAELVADGYLKRYPGKGTFVIDPARGGAELVAHPAARDATIAAISRNLHYRESTTWLTAAMDACYRRGAAAITNYTSGDPFREIALLRQAARLHLDGIIVHSNITEPPSPTVCEQLERLNLGSAIPTVSIGTSTAMSDATHVWIDEEHAGYIATRHLIDQGHQRIAHIAWVHSQRHLGYLRAMDEADLPIPDGYIIDIATVPHASKTIEMSRNAGKILFSHPTPPTAVFAYWSEVAVGIMLEALDRGMRVPDDLALVGMDAEMEEPTRSIVPIPLSRVFIDMHAIGKIAIEELFKEMSGTETHGRDIRINAQLQPAASSGITN